MYAWIESPAAITVRAARPQGARLAATLSAEDSRAEPDAGDAADCPLSGQQHDASDELSAAPLCAALHAADIELLAAVDELHETLSGPAARRILQREYPQYSKPEYERLATISVAHLYNLRHQRYRERRLTYNKTKPNTVSIGERRPDPQGRPGHLRGLTRCTGATRTRPKASTTSTLSTRSFSGRSSPSASAKPGWSRCWPCCYANFLSAFAAFIRQRQRVHQLVRGPSAQQADQADQEPPPPQQLQRIGGKQEWRHRPQAHGLRPHRHRRY